YFRWGSPPKD
nr:melanotropin 9-18,9-Tyr [Sus scrofa domesticus]